MNRHNRHPQVPSVVWTQTTQGFVMRCSTCGAAATAGTPEGVDAFAAEHQHPQRAPMGLGDVVAAATKAVGIKPCKPCEKRQAQLNGWLPRVWKL